MGRTHLAAGTLLTLLVPAAALAQQEYPNIAGETILEDDRVVVQRFVLQPGQDEGIHEHPEHQLVIVLQSSGELVTRFRGEETTITSSEEDPSSGPQIGAFWRPGPVTLGDEHTSINTGTRPLEWIAITFKSDSIATDDARPR